MKGPVSGRSAAFVNADEQEENLMPKEPYERFQFPSSFQLRPSLGKLGAARSIAFRVYSKLPKLPLVNPNALNWRHLTKTGCLVIGKWWKTQRILAYPIATTWGSATGGLPFAATGAPTPSPPPIPPPTQPVTKLD